MRLAASALVAVSIVFALSSCSAPAPRGAAPAPDAAKADAGPADVPARDSEPKAEPTPEPKPQPETVPEPVPEPKPEAPAASWPQLRGPLGTGVARDANPPVEWSEQKNVRWKASVPGRGHSSPIVWGDRVILTTAMPTDKATDATKVRAVEEATPRFHRRKARMPRRVVAFVVMALRRSNGEVLWSRTVAERAPHQATHADGSWASQTPVTDGKRIYAYFGSYGLHCLDMNGEPVWKKDFGLLKMKANFGEGSSPVLCGDTVVVSQDQEGDSFIVALDGATGDEKWRAARDERTSWSTPLVVEHEGRRQVLVNATKRIRSYDAETGKVIWEASGMTGNVIPVPVIDEGVVVFMSGFRGNASLAVRLDEARGDVMSKPEAIAWTYNRNTPYTPSPLAYDGCVYFLKTNRATLSCADVATGMMHYEAEKLEGVRGVYASPVGASGRVYITGRRGLTVVLKNGPKLEVIARNQLDDEVTASVAVVDGELFLRGHESLYCIARD